MIKLIINADDFGMSMIFNEKILELLEKRLIKSTTVMINRVTEEQRTQLNKLVSLKDKISIGLHVELDLEKPMPEQVEEQYNKFIKVFGFKPSHLDVHKMTRNENAVKTINEFAHKHNLPTRNHDIPSDTKQTTDRVLVSVKGDYEEILNFLKKMNDGHSYEIAMHPGKYDSSSKSSLNKQREAEFDCIVRLQDFLRENKNVKLISYLEL